MSLDTPHIRPVIRQLDEAAINRIAAGEVVERPASAVKELVENALDAGATRITIDIAAGGKALIRVTDDGCGMTADDLPLALSRHATSKIDGSDLQMIHSFGFRGEALPSLGAVGRLTITSRPADSDKAHQMTVTGGDIAPVRPAALGRGTVVELKDLFYATPARLKFLRSDRAEMQAITDVIKRLAMAEPGVGFILRDVNQGAARVIFRADPENGDFFDALRNRLRAILGRDFIENALPIDTERDGLRLNGYAALPTYSRGAAVAQFIFVNGRPVRDRVLTGALRAAYSDVLSRDRHPVAALFLGCDPKEIDVNVHPAKSEVRFKDPGLVRGLIITGLRHGLAGAGHRASSTLSGGMLGRFQRQGDDKTPPRPNAALYQAQPPSHGAIRRAQDWQSPGFADGAAQQDWAVAPSSGHMPLAEPQAQAFPLGAAQAQIHQNYILAQTQSGLVIVDQHAAHERLVYEKLKQQAAENGIARQALLIPEIVTLGTSAEVILSHADDLADLGLVIESFGPGTVAVRETPAILGVVDAENLLNDILDEITDLGESGKLKSRIDAVLSRVACHGSIRSGRRMTGEEMNALLREMEATPLAGQCNHGRPTYIELKLSDIEHLFGRS
jgi:DNA mismatch repair protein MutL